MTIEQETARVLGNLGWAHLQLHNYGIAEHHYRRALCLEPDKNKQCNLAICLMRMGRIPEAKSLIDDVRDHSAESESGDEPFSKSYDRAVEMLAEVESTDPEGGLPDEFYAGCSFANGTMKENKAPRNANRKYSHVPSSPASVRQNSAGLFTQPRGYKMDQTNGVSEEETGGAARKLLFDKPVRSERVKNLKSGEGGEEPMKGKKLDQNMIHDLHEYINDTSDCLKSGTKKSWADMAEEEDEERLQ
ncbi:Tetratricopeptide repeat (TPR)-like superfamily protein [Raphanus sativus]|nr:Tetratricopeptide repeat (TPR)-like superfamily protein [Raphanus sativus]